MEGPPDFNTALTIISLAVAVIALIYARHLYRKQVRDKLLCVDQIQPQRIASVSNEAVALITLQYDSVPVQAVWRSLVLLWNRGYRAIEPSDFLTPIMASCAARGRFLACGIANVDLATNATVISTMRTKSPR